MATKNKPGKFDCYANAGPDEPMFVFLGRDPMAPALIDLWAALREESGEDPAKVEEARACATAMRQWAADLAKGGRVDQADYAILGSENETTDVSDIWVRRGGMRPPIKRAVIRWKNYDRWALAARKLAAQMADNHCGRDPSVVGSCGGTDANCSCECTICLDPT